jgi:hypothetical protein
MREIIIALIMLLLVMFVPQFAKAEVVSANEADTGFSITFPMETAATGFWFPDTGAFAAGVSHTFMRVKHSAIKFMSIDFDGTLAQEVSQGDNTLFGLGIKANLDFVKLPSDNGFAFVPSIGVTALNNFNEFRTFNDIADHYEIAVYGSVLLYKW